MLFNSIDFVVFLPTVFFVYWFVLGEKLHYQNVFIAIASYVFYGWWDWRFLSLIIFSSLVDYICGTRIEKNDREVTRKFYLWLSVCVNLGFLGFFKYFNFFSESFADLLNTIGLQANPFSINVILPVGISFYTFQTMSYTIDVYRGNMRAEKNIISFLAYVSFFPQLVAGPIERAVNLLPQFNKQRKFDYKEAINGLQLIIWGLFKKVVVADNCAYLVNSIFQNYQHESGYTLILGSVFFAFQIYGDFSGYSDIAIGVAKLFGFDLMTNFRTPYFSRDVAEFWRRWHISLSTWFRDYVYIPLGGSRVSKPRAVLNTFVIFIVSGFWHGANWTFIIWGALNAIYFLPLLLRGANRKNTDSVAQGRNLPSLKELSAIIKTFILTCLAWIFFRADSVSQAINYISRIFSSNYTEINLGSYLKPILLISVLLFFDWVNRDKELPFYFEKPVYRRMSYGLVILMILYFGVYVNPNSFIYFQF